VDVGWVGRSPTGGGQGTGLKEGGRDATAADGEDHRVAPSGEGLEGLGEEELLSAGLSGGEAAEDARTS